MWREPWVLITPLVGGMSNIFLDQAYPIVLHNLRQFLAGTPQAMNKLVPHPAKAAA